MALNRTHGNRAREGSWLGSARTIVEGTGKVNFADGAGRARLRVDRGAAFNDGAAKSRRPRDNEPPPGTGLGPGPTGGQEVNVRQRVAPAGAFAHWGSSFLGEAGLGEAGLGEAGLDEADRHGGEF
jgi:hypothetical protein